jgi:uncharacterized protein YjbI with pentapeptide repeats
VKVCDFRNANLEGADFTDSALEETGFAGAILKGAIFTGAGIHSYRMKKDEKPDW